MEQAGLWFVYHIVLYAINEMFHSFFSIGALRVYYNKVYMAREKSLFIAWVK